MVRMASFLDSARRSRVTASVPAAADDAAGEMPVAVPLGGTRQQAMQRLQIGVTGVMLMVLLVGLASVIQGRADQTDATTVPDAAPTTEPTEEKPKNDPLAEAGVVPDMPTQQPATAQPVVIDTAPPPVIVTDATPVAE